MPYTEFTSTVISPYPNEDVLDGYIVIVSDFESGSFPLEPFRPWLSGQTTKCTEEWLYFIKHIDLIEFWGLD